MAKNPTYEQILAMPLTQQAAFLEERRHSARLRELKDMTSALALLEAERPAIQATGYNLTGDWISPSFGEKLTLSVCGTIFDGDFRLARALLVAGFTIVDRGTSDTYPSIRFKKGRLTIRSTLRLTDLERAELAAAEALAPAPKAAEGKQ
ncbi:hypothetical protein KB879_06130 [Cupriavidus sp. KK10]|jgi:hypothetical protein|uniref:hypothetical protein n=1 Tax=Cupriavidus sp. KK10 TaxID=1478019 RepID=UPI001BAB6208|nr:hypothetical protein [Cupriavidus sp. KK10]QUN29523.1 hypothetical protein KB879_06130 [Cupriavidus sp. KK10]